MLLVRVGEVEFHGHTDSGFLIGPKGFKGWEGAPATRRERSDRPGGHGQFPARAYKNARLVTLSGTALGTSEADVAFMSDVLAGIGQDVTRVTVTTEAGTRWADGSVEGPIVWERVGGTSEAEFELSFLFADPFKYGETRQTVNSGSTFTQSFHYGNAPAIPKFTVTGNMTSGYSLVGKGGRVFSVPQSLPTGQTATIDFRTGIVRHDGVRVANVTPSWWSVGGGEQVGWQLVPVTGSGTATCYLTDTFL